MERKTAIILAFILILAILLGGNFLRSSDIYSNPRGGYTTAEVSSAVVVVNGGNILHAGYDEIVIRAQEPHLLINILGSGFERNFNITVKNLIPDVINIPGSYSIVNEGTQVRFASTVPARLVKEINLTPTGNLDNFSFTVMGDSRDNPRIFQNILNQSADAQSLFIIHLGDMVEDGTQKEYSDLVRLLDTSALPVYTVPGNHDIKGKGRSYYSRNFGMYYYSFDVGTTHFILLDNAKGSLGPDQLDWLRTDLQGNNASNVMVFMHMPPFDPRDGNDHAMTDSTEANTLISLLGEFQVDLVFAGHIHSYIEAEQANIPYIITGGGGAPQGQDDSEYHYVMVHVSDENITTEMVAV